MPVGIALLSGLLFGGGLALSGMTDPARIRGFLDILGPWDPTLAFVMAGAIPVMATAWLVQRRMQRPHAAADFVLPATTTLDGRLVLGSLLFGTGWGSGGLCPGPGIAALSIAPLPAFIFVAAMLLGMTLHRAVIR